MGDIDEYKGLTPREAKLRRRENGIPKVSKKEKKRRRDAKLFKNLPAQTKGDLFKHAWLPESKK
jgi:hypothetical protein